MLSFDEHKTRFSMFTDSPGFLSDRTIPGNISGDRCQTGARYVIGTTLNRVY
jgi:hypothetical protein